MRSLLAYGIIFEDTNKLEKIKELLKSIQFQALELVYSGVGEEYPVVPVIVARNYISLGEDEFEPTSVISNLNLFEISRSINEKDFKDIIVELFALAEVPHLMIDSGWHLIQDIGVQ